MEIDWSLNKRWEEDPSPAAKTPAALLDTDILEEIFLNLPPKEVVCLCRLVCDQWKEVADCQSFWKKRCRREGYRIQDASKLPQDWRLFYFLCKKGRNLLTIVEKNVVMNHPDSTVKMYVETSFGRCSTSQLIDFKKKGYNPSFMDYFQPDIRISNWSSPRSVSGSLFEVRAYLLNERKEIVQTFAPGDMYFDADFCEEWRQVTHVFRNYGPGVRFMSFNHGGIDVRYWSCVEI